MGACTPRIIILNRGGSRKKLGGTPSVYIYIERERLYTDGTKSKVNISLYKKSKTTFFEGWKSLSPTTYNPA